MKQRIDINVAERTTGKHFSRSLRKDRQIPAVVYGTTTKNKSIQVFEGDILRYNVLAYENALFNLKSTDGDLNGKVVLMKQVDVHPVTRKPEHVDFFALDLTKPVRVDIEIRVEGKPIGIAEGGLLNVVNRTVSVECLPTEIPDSIVIDVSAMGIGDALHVSDLKIPAGVKIITGMSQTIAVVNMAEEEAVAVVAVDPAAAVPGAAVAAGAPGAPGAAPAAGAPAAAGAKPAPGAAAPAAGAKAPAGKK